MRLLITAGTLALLLGACSDDSSPPAPDTGAGGDAAVADSGTTSDGGACDHQGAWQGCLPMGSTSMAIFELNFSGTQLVESISHYRGKSSCSGVPDEVDEWTFDISVMNEVSTPAGAKIIKFIPTALTKTPKTQGQADRLNSADSGAGWCGQNDWTVDVAKDLFALGCPDLIMQEGTAYYTIIKQENCNQLSLGNFDNGMAADPSGVPTTLISPPLDRITR